MHWQSQAAIMRPGAGVCECVHVIYSSSLLEPDEEGKQERE
jgi:hypothetical protein